jgi:hypothetical protein
VSTLRTWAAKWGVSIEAVVDLEREFGIAPIDTAHDGSKQDKSEAYAQSQVVLEAPRVGVRLFRNNSGALKDKDGRLVRYGLGNTSSAFNEMFKSPDLVGWRKLLIQQHHVGTFVAQTVLREMKAPGWQYSGDPHEEAQLRFMQLCAADGGDVMFATGLGTL